MVEEMVKFLFSAGASGPQTDTFHHLPSLDPSSPPVQNVISVLFRGAFAVGSTFKTFADGELFVAGRVGQLMNGASDMDSGDSLQKITGSLFTNYEDDGRAGLMNGSLLLAAIIQRTVDESLQSSNISSDSPLHLITPGAVAGLVVAFYFFRTLDLLAHPGKALGIDPEDLREKEEDACVDYAGKDKVICAYLARHNFDNMDVASVREEAEKGTWQAFGAIALGVAEEVLTGYLTLLTDPKNRKAVVEAFAEVNKMIGESIEFAFAGTEAKERFERSGQEAGDRYSGITDTMGTVTLLDTFEILFAGALAGHSASLSNEPWTVEYWPFYLGLAIRFGKIAEADKMPDTAGTEAEVAHKKVVKKEWGHLGLFAGMAFVSFLINKWRQRPKGLKPVLICGRYRVQTKLGTTPEGLLQAEVRTERVTAEDQALARRIEEKEGLLKERQTELDHLGQATVPEGANPFQWRQARAEELDHSIVALRDGLESLRSLEGRSASQIGRGLRILDDQEILVELDREIKALEEGARVPPPDVTITREEWVAQRRRELFAS